ncbi:MAG TPA: glycoside hydrolase family 3 N-terminal domain-containing protein [Gemmatimonadaceae bacterium]|nr:glycoside hydrolase family 3 N-terminal domain-containing protein [Gemmatimonadaceae bacterium]
MPASGTTIVSSAGPGSALSSDPAADLRWADSVLATLSLRDKAAQMVWPWVLGDYTPDDDANFRRIQGLFRDQHLGGLIISVGSPTEIAAKLNALQRSSRLPLLVGADLETGAAFRARGGFFLPNGIDLGGATAFPYAMGIGATRDSSLAYAMGRATALEGRALGIHMAFAPVVDVNNNPKNPVISLRSFGEDPQLVARLGAAEVRGIQENGMLATAKHFPGHGDTEQNSHLELARVDASRARIDSVELVPFRAAVQAGVRGVMTFHGIVPALDTTPIAATLNPRIMTDLLRGDLGFRGLVITDALDMNGVLGKMSMAEVTQRAVLAGADVLLMPTDNVGAIDAVVDGVRTGRFPESRVDASVRKLLVAKHELRLDRQRFVDIQALRAVVGDSANQAAARTAAERAITLVKDSLNIVPLGRLARTARVVSITIAPKVDLGAGTAFNGELARAFPALRTLTLSPESLYGAASGAGAGAAVTGGTYVASPQPALFPASVENALRAAQGADVAVVSSYFGASSSTASLAAPDGMAALIDGLQKNGAKVVLATFSNPYIATELPATSTYLIAWGSLPISQRAAARALLGLAPITGQLPITIPAVAGYGAGLRRDVLTAPSAAATP